MLLTFFPEQMAGLFVVLATFFAGALVSAAAAHCFFRSKLSPRTLPGDSCDTATSDPDTTAMTEGEMLREVLRMLEKRSRAVEN